MFEICYSKSGAALLAVEKLTESLSQKKYIGIVIISHIRTFEQPLVPRSSDMKGSTVATFKNGASIGCYIDLLLARKQVLGYMQ